MYQPEQLYVLVCLSMTQHHSNVGKFCIGEFKPSRAMGTVIHRRATYQLKSSKRRLHKL